MEEEYLIAIDGGGTKTLGRILSIKTGQTWERKAGASSLTNNPDSACDVILNLATSLLNDASADAESSAIVCGVAGAGNQERKAQLENKLYPKFSKILVVNDGVTSLYGAGEGEPIIVVALGTGSVATRLDKKGNITQFGGWGFLVGDEGGGAQLGLELVKETLKYRDQQKDKEIRPPIINECLGIIGESRQEILAWVNNAKPACFAKLAPILFNYQDSSHLAQRIIKKSVSDILELIERAQPSVALPIALVGGLAKPLFPYLTPSLKGELIESKGGSLEGGIFLAKKLIKNNKNPIQSD